MADNSVPSIGTWLLNGATIIGTPLLLAGLIVAILAVLFPNSWTRPGQARVVGIWFAILGGVPVVLWGARHWFESNYSD